MSDQDIVNELLEGRELVVLMRFGSHLYGTNTPESDVDYKGVFLPSKEEVILQKVPPTLRHSSGDEHGKNTKDDIDVELFSIHTFIKHACEGQTAAIDMIHAPDTMIMESSLNWEFITANKDRFYHRELAAFVDYARKQANKYGIKGSRMDAVAKTVEYLNSRPDNEKLADIWDCLPLGEHIVQYPATDSGSKPGIYRMHEVCNRKFQETAKVKYTRDALQLVYERYGARALSAKNNENIDWKALSHALRAAYQLEELFTTGNIVFPLKSADFLRQVKMGELDYTTEVAPLIEEKMELIEELSKNSDLPEDPDFKFWKDFILETYK